MAAYLRGRPRQLSAEAGAKASLPAAASFEDVVRQLETVGSERDRGVRQLGLFDGED